MAKAVGGLAAVKLCVRKYAQWSCRYCFYTDAFIIINHTNMYVGPWQEYKLYQLISLKDKHKPELPSARQRNSSNESKNSDNKSVSTHSIAESSQTHSIYSNATTALKGYYNQWRDYDSQVVFAQRKIAQAKYFN